MQFTCRKEDLVAGISLVERAVSTKEAVPVLSGILLEAQEASIRLVATDLELGIECRVPAKVEHPGAAVVDARFFGQVVRKLPGEELSYTRNDEGFAEISSGRADFQIRVLAADEFPGMPEIEAQQTVVLSQATLKNMIRQTVFAAAPEDARPFLTGILMEIEGQELRLVATDSNRLAFRKAQLPEGPGFDKQTVVPARSFSELARILSGREEDVITVTFGVNQIGFQTDEVRFVSRLIEGQFPNYRHVFPQEQPVTVEVSRQLLLDAVERVALVSKKGLPVVIITAESGKLVLNTREAEIGNAHEELEVRHTGDELKTAYQARFLLDVLRAVTTEEVRLELNHGDRQGSLRSVGDEDYLYVMMPVRTA